MKRAFIFFFLITLLPARSAFAQAPEIKAEARERFDRGLQLFEEGDNQGALAEFRRAHELIPNNLVLFNIGLVYATLRQPVQAVATFDRVLAAPGSLSADRLALARTTRDDQSKRIGEIEVTSNVPAAIEVDGIEVGKTPLAQPIKVAEGTHVVAALATGHLPRRVEVTVAGGSRGTQSFELLPSERRVAQVNITSAMPGLEILVDGEVVGRTPFSASVTVAPGKRVIEARRPGYQTARREFDYGDGATGEAAFALDEDTNAPASLMGRLALVINESEAQIDIDGRARGVYRETLRLPGGPHRVRVERGGFEPVDRIVEVSPGAVSTVRITLEPTPETRVAHVDRARGQRRRALIALVGGLVVAAGGSVLGIVSNGNASEAEKDVQAINDSFVLGSGGKCDQAGGINLPIQEQCVNELADAESRRDSARTLRAVGFVGAGVGLVSAVVGTVLLLTAEDPHRYDRPGGDSAPYAALPRLALTGWFAEASGGMALTGRF